MRVPVLGDTRQMKRYRSRYLDVCFIGPQTWPGHFFHLTGPVCLDRNQNANAAAPGPFNHSINICLQHLSSCPSIWLVWHLKVLTTPLLFNLADSTCCCCGCWPTRWTHLTLDGISARPWRYSRGCPADIRLEFRRREMPRSCSPLCSFDGIAVPRPFLQKTTPMTRMTSSDQEERSVVTGQPPPLLPPPWLNPPDEALSFGPMI